MSLFKESENDDEAVVGDSMNTSASFLENIFIIPIFQNKRL